MIDGFTEAQVINGLLVLLVALLAAFFAWIVRRFDKIDAKMDRLDERLIAKIDALTIAVSRLERAVYHGRPSPSAPSRSCESPSHGGMYRVGSHSRRAVAHATLRIGQAPISALSAELSSRHYVKDSVQRKLVRFAWPGEGPCRSRPLHCGSNK